MSPKKLFAWRLWKTKIPCPKEGWVILCVRAFDNSANSQPQYERDIWNWKGWLDSWGNDHQEGVRADLSFHFEGYLNNAYHKIKIYSANLAYAQTAKRIAQVGRSRRGPASISVSVFDDLVSNSQMKIHGDSLEPLKKTLAFDPELEDPADKFVEG